MMINTYSKLLPEGGSAICLASNGRDVVLARFYDNVVVAGDMHPAFIRHREGNWRSLCLGEEAVLSIGDEIRIDVSEREPSVYLTVRHKSYSVL